jgi:hypothetical protein
MNKKFAISHLAIVLVAFSVSKLALAGDSEQPSKVESLYPSKEERVNPEDKKKSHSASHKQEETDSGMNRDRFEAYFMRSLSHD